MKKIRRFSMDYDFLVSFLTAQTLVTKRGWGCLDIRDFCEDLYSAYNKASDETCMLNELDEHGYKLMSAYLDELGYYGAEKSYKQVAKAHKLAVEKVMM